MEVAEFIGLRFEDYNCAALVVKVARERLGLEIPLHVSECTDPMDREEVDALIRGEVVKRWVRVDAGREADGDVVLFRMGGLPVHIGLLIGDGRFLHVLPGREACVERLDSISWRSRLVGVYRWSV